MKLSNQLQTNIDHSSVFKADILAGLNKGLVLHQQQPVIYEPFVSELGHHWFR